MRNGKEGKAVGQLKTLYLFTCLLLFVPQLSCENSDDLYDMHFSLAFVCVFTFKLLLCIGHLK